MADYNPQQIEKKWQRYWQQERIFEVKTDTGKPKYYVLDMFPYPSGAGLHVGHPLGYIASDIVTRYRRLKGYNVLHPMGFDAFGLPAEQYAIQTGQHPAITTAQNIKRYKEQLHNLGLSYDWSREVQTCDPQYYRWTQWIFMQLFNSWYNKQSDRAEPIETLISLFEKEGSQGAVSAGDDDAPTFSATEWAGFSEKDKAQVLLHHRLTYPAEAVVNWCPALGTVLANDEVKDGFSERGGHPVERRKMRQWMMRITAYADRLLRNLEGLDWSPAMKEMQANWIGKSYGCELHFPVVGQDFSLTCFTTRADTIYGVTYVVIAPEHELVARLTTPAQRDAVTSYVQAATNRSERDRMAEVKTVSGVFTGSYVVNPFTKEEVPLWIADYVLAGYGTGVVMAVPSSDDRDFRFATHYNLPIKCVIAGTEKLDDPTEIKHGKMINSGFLNGLDSKEAIQKANAHAEEKGIGKAKVNYKMRDAVFSRQRYWGEPVPVYYVDDVPYLIQEDELPLELPGVDEYKPTEDGDPPLGRATDWKYNGMHSYELTTMPGWAGSSWYFLRYMDAHNDEAPVGEDAVKYWGAVDLYIGGTEHATGHLLYSRFWNMFLFDRGVIFHEEPFQKLVNQGMIQGRSNIIYKLKSKDTFVSHGLKEAHDIIALHVDVNIVENDVLDIDAFKRWMPEYKNAEFLLENGQYRCGYAVEKMSKRWYNVVNPDDVIARYGADTLRMYEMFLGPLELSKPWNTHGIDGVFKFLRRFYNLFHNKSGQFDISTEKPGKDELKALHKTIKKIAEDIANLSFNTSVSEFMICVNTLSQLQCNKKAILEPLTIVLSPFAPHLCEELWQLMGHTDSIINAEYPALNEEYIQEEAHEYPIMINGKLRTKVEYALDKPSGEIEQDVQQNEVVKKWLEGKPPKKIIVVPGKIINIVV
jgi:leucyl-tRNA synthetase